MTKRIQVVFDERAAEVLSDLQVSTGDSIASVVRDAIGFYDWARKEVEAGRTVAIVDHEKNKVREFILPFRRKS